MSDIQKKLGDAVEKLEKAIAIQETEQARTQRLYIELSDAFRDYLHVTSVLTALARSCVNDDGQLLGCLNDMTTQRHLARSVYEKLGARRTCYECGSPFVSRHYKDLSHCAACGQRIIDEEDAKP